MLNIKKYETGINNFFIFISHKDSGDVNCSYGLVSEDGKSMVEIVPKYGPITVIYSDNVLEKYINDYKSLDRGNWSQNDFDKSGINNDLADGDLENIANKLSNHF
jgi:hypothetical protein